MDKKITIFRNLYKSSDVPYYLTLEQVYNRIRNGSQSTELIKLIRKGIDVDKNKKKLPCILFSGEFTHRAKDGLKKHSGFLVFDLDDVKNIQKTKEELKKIPYVALIFTSPSGNGIKFVIRIPECTEEEHTQYWIAFSEEYSYLDLDPSGKDVSRVCFESYDPKAYINREAIVYSPKLIDKGHNIMTKPPLIPIQDENEIINRIINFNWSTSFSKGERNIHAFNLASAFCEYGVSEYSALSYILNFKEPDFTEKEITTTVKGAYRQRQFNIRYFEDKKKIEEVKSNLGRQKEYVLKKFGIDDYVYTEIKNEVEETQFWEVTQTKSGERKIKVRLLYFKKFLEGSGFKKYYPEGAEEPIFVKVQSNIVEHTSASKIKDHVLTYLEKLNDEAVWSYFTSYSTLFSSNFLNMLETIELDILRDEKEKSYIAFRNGILEVTKEDIRLIEYIDIDYFIWKEHIIDKEFKRVSKTDNDFSKFIKNVSKGDELAFKSTIGYLLSGYKNLMNNRAVILNDEVISENPEGGTGKGLFLQAIGEIRKVSRIDGKTFNENKSFPYQTVSEDTHILLFDDVGDNFDFEKRFSLITEGIILEKKNRDAIALSVQDSPKVVITTNYAIKGSGNSHRRRRHEIELAQFYSEDFTPADEFKRQLFIDWDEKEYNRFYNYMVECIQVYLDKGLLKQENALNIELRHFIAETSKEFYTYMNERFNKYDENLSKTKEYELFQEVYPDFKANWFKQNRFTIWMKKWCKYKGFEFEEFLFNGHQYFKIITKKEEEAPF